MEFAVLTHADLLDGIPGAHLARTGLTQRSAVARGFNGVSSGALLVLEDDRPARLPSRRTNRYELLSSTLLDVERVELLRGPASALYGPNATAGVLRIVTTSPIDRPGSAASLSMGERGVVHGAVRGTLLSEPRAGLRISGQYARGRDWAASDALEVTARDPDQERGGARARLDLRPWEEGEIVVTAGTSRVQSSVALLEGGAAQLEGWSQSFAQARARKGNAFAQTFFTQGDAGSSVDLRTGARIVDRSRLFGGQLQYVRRVAGRLDLTGGVDLTRTDPRTGGTVHGIWEDEDRIVEAGGYGHAAFVPSQRVRISGGLRLDRHTRFDGVRFSPRLALSVEPVGGIVLRGAFNRGYTDPTPGVLFSDRVTDRIPLLDTLGFDVRTVGLPSEGLTFGRSCRGGLDDRCMFTPFRPGVRLPATAAAVWDDWLVPLALESEVLRSRLAAISISPRGFAQIIGRPQLEDLDGRLLLWSGGAVAFDATSPPQPVQRLKPSMTQSWEVGFNAVASRRLAISLDLHSTRIEDLVGPVEVTTPTLFLDRASVEAYLIRRMTGVGIPADLAGEIATNIGATTSGVPLGTLAPDQRDGSDLLRAYRNVGPVKLWGADVGLRLLATDRVSVRGSFSYLNEDCFDLDADGTCGSPADVSVNAPGAAGSATVRWADAVLGVTAEARFRHAAGFDMASGVYRGRVEGHSVFDVNALYRLPWSPGVTVSVAVSNVLGSAYRDFVGAPETGRLGLVRVLYEF
jgi:iron complex outermembrane receptor protein